MSITFVFKGYSAKIEKDPMPDGNRLYGPQKMGQFSGRAIIARTAEGYRGEPWVLLRSHAKTPAGDELQEKQEPALADWLIKHHNEQIENMLGIPSERKRAHG